MKIKYRATGKRLFTFRLWTVIAFGYNQQYFHYNKHYCQNYQSWYFLCFALSSTQYFTKFEL